MSSIQELIGGDPTSVAKELADFRANVQILSSERDRLIDRFECKWVGIVKGKVVVSGDSTEDVISQLTHQGENLEAAVVRLIDRDLKTLIL